MSATKVVRKSIQKVDKENLVQQDDLLAVEEPLEIRLKYYQGRQMLEKRLAVTMRTPGNDLELVTGFLFCENIICAYTDIEKIYHCLQVKSEEEQGNVVIVQLRAGVTFDLKKIERHFYTTSSCGVCGKASIEALDFVVDKKNAETLVKIPQSVIYNLPEKLQHRQLVFGYTGGLHAAALFDLGGKLKVLREDIGRHNALDKLIGVRLFEKQAALENDILVVSGRLGFELIQKSIVAGINTVVAIGAPSSLAVKTAEAFDITLVGFVKKDRFNIYTGKHRILL
ncbi:formate dehydrogenase accessory sulfurtransferase FdhD [Fulvivirgaceae bacterium BMA12]|uniref:Sulfur carrier protein FdhD n=1 Tax=Agaribacillus aureus TaxID=3051825 RepID=A0ABT8LHN9_9BACT|nr:formate dehydrogenase accessory sulfurtransferase FdhD [Fulvivirgaceae bacterium BMA12]